MQYYLLLLLICLMDGSKTLAQKCYLKRFGAGPDSSLLLLFLICAFFVPVGMLAGARFTFTPMAFWMALVFAVISVTCTLVGFAVLHIGNMSKYTLFLYMGGMLIPFAYGLVFNGDGLSVGKVLCILLVLYALTLNLDKEESKSKKAILYYLLVFLLNGLACVVIAMHQSAILGGQPVSSDDFTLWYIALTALLCIPCLGVRLWASKGKTLSALFPAQTRNGKSILGRISLSLYAGASYGFGNLLLALCLLHVEPSAQFPFLTGGSILVVGLLGLFIGERINKKFILSTAVVMAGCILLLLSEIGTPLLSFRLL